MSDYTYFILVFIFGYYIGRKSAINKLFISESKALNEIEKEMDKILVDLETLTIKTINQ